MRNRLFMATMLIAVVLAGCFGSMPARAASGPGDLTIINAHVSFAQGTITIEGVNFSDSYVSLNGWQLAVLPGATSEVVVARLPPGLTPEAAGGYRLMVAALDKRGRLKPGAGNYDQFDVTIGDAGPGGPRGESGSVGLTGEAGPVGPPGGEGPRGEPGPTGPAGLKGEPGPEGSMGAFGSMGPPGPSGATGPAGMSGPMGSQGPVGPPGAASVLGACQSVPTHFVLNNRWSTCPGTHPVLRGFYRNNINQLDGIESLLCCQVGPGF